MARELLRTVVAFALASGLLTLYGGRVCPLIDSLGLGRLAGILAGCFAAGAALKLAAIAWWKPHQGRVSPWWWFLADLSIWFAVAVIFAAFDLAVWKFPFWTSGMKMAAGTLSLGFYASAYEALRRERELIEAAAAGSQRPVGGPPLKTAQRFFAFTFGSLLLLCLVVLLLLYKDLVMEEIPVVLPGVEAVPEPVALPDGVEPPITKAPAPEPAVDPMAAKKAMLAAAAAAPEDAMAAKKAMSGGTTRGAHTPAEWYGAIFKEIFFALGVMLACTIVVSAKYAGNLRRMFELEQGALDAVKRGSFAVRVPVVSRDEFSDIADGTNGMIAGLEEKEKYRSILGKVVSTPVAKRIVERGAMLGGETVEATVLFTDLRDYTTLSEKLSPQQVVSMLNEYFTVMNRVIEKNGGFVNKFIGNAVMAVFGLDRPDGACEAAVRAALEAKTELAALNERLRARGLPPIANGIGVHHGPLVAGVIGAEERVEFTVIGDTVNTASRLESLTKSLPSFVAVSKAVYERVPPATQELLAPAGEHPLKGKAEKLAVYGLR